MTRISEITAPIAPKRAPKKLRYTGAPAKKEVTDMEPNMAGEVNIAIFFILKFGCYVHVGTGCVISGNLGGVSSH